MTTPDNDSSPVLSDDSLFAFIAWCRANEPTFVYDTEIARRVFNAYCRDAKQWFGPPHFKVSDE